MRYLPHTPEDIREMLQDVGVESLSGLFSSIPAELQVKGHLELLPALAEPDLRRELERLAGPITGPQFIGAGAYPHAVPAAVEQLLLRSELYTAYTPYQPEVAQGTLQSMFEFQTMVAEIMGLDAANASLYDGATATAEAVLMALRVARKKTRVLIAGTLHPEYREVIETFTRAQDAPVETVGRDEATGRVDLTALAARAKDAGVIVVQTPNFLGVVEDGPAIGKIAREAGAILVVAVPEVLALGLFAPPGSWGADIATGEGLGYGVGVQLGGPACGLFACRQDFIRQMPGRLVGEAVDSEGNRGFVLTLSTREQHIRREKATSNICTNQGLLALGFAMHVALLGKQGFVAAARQNLARAQHLTQALAPLGLVRRYAGPHFNEVAYRLPGGRSATALVESIAQQEGLVAGLSLGRFDPALADTVLICTTEVHDRRDMDRLVAAIAREVKS